MTRKALVIALLVVVVLAGAAIVWKSTEKSEAENMEKYTAAHEPRIGYLELRVSDLEQSSAFYEELIGFSILSQDEQTIHLTTDGETPQLVLKQEADFMERPAKSTGLYHFAILVPTRQDLALSLLHLAESGYPLQGAADHQYSEAVYLADPDNNGIEIYTDRDSAEWVGDGKGGYVGATNPLEVEDLMLEAEGVEWSGLSDGTRIGHIHLQASDLAAAEEFYIDALGFDVVAKDSHMLFVSKDAYHHHIGMNAWAGPDLTAPPSNALGLSHFTFYLTDSEYGQAKTGLAEKNFAFEEQEGLIVVKDPAGNQLNLLKAE